MARNRDYEKSPIRGSSRYEMKVPGDLIRDRSTGELMLVIDRQPLPWMKKEDRDGILSTHCMVQYVDEVGDGQTRLATWFVDYECNKV